MNNYLYTRLYHCRQRAPVGNALSSIIILYDHNTYFLSSPVCQTCLIDLYRKMTEHFRPELFDDSDIVVYINNCIDYFCLFLLIYYFIDYSDIDKMMDINNEKC
jgi:hypothetical protein